MMSFSVKPFLISNTPRSFLLVFLQSFVPTLVVLALMVGGYFYINYLDQLDKTKAYEIAKTELGHRAIEQFIQKITADVRILAESVTLQRMLQNPSAQNTADLAQEFEAFSRYKGIYDQIRFFDESGMEVVRVNYESGRALIVARDKLQQKHGRYYFKDAFRLERGQLYISPLDLNIEKNTIQRPYKPMIRIGTPVFDRDGRKRGVVLVNYLASEILQRFELLTSSAEAQAFVINAEGYWIVAGDSALEWGFMLDRNKRFSLLFPEIWQQFLNNSVGQVSTGEHIFSWKTVYPLSSHAISSSGSIEPIGQSNQVILDHQYFWKVGTHVTSRIVRKWREQEVYSALSLFLMISVLALFGNLLLAKSRLREQLNQSELASSERLLNIITSELAEGLIVLDAKGRLRMMNREAQRLLGWSEDELVGKDFHQQVHPLRACKSKQDCALLLAANRGMIQTDDDAVFFCRDGSSRALAYSAAPMLIDDRQSGLILTFQDITEQKKAKEQLIHLATHDPLTGLSNRRASELRLQELYDLSERYNKPLSVCMVDIDYFKKVNDSYGHLVGDLVLRRIAKCLLDSTRRVDCAGRYGGEEFLLILAETSVQGALQLGELLRKRVEQLLIEVEGLEDVLSVTISIGVAENNLQCSNPDQLIKQADDALYRAKKEGRNRVCG